ncbi:arylesterase [Rufibacter latericius]|uniref:Arylesterase n=1 Tax=Rufibacter latericius TaxID=2487040 RepID=A0A3M9MYW0_9BACT|nr:arylesterase [Rufibacter latericius]RNI30741.1 arylesterase [Rufibacter latericius]
MYKHSFIYLLLLALLAVGCSGNGDAQDEAQAKKEAAKKAPETMKNILFFGNSLTAGYGLNPSESFPALIQKKIDSLDLPYKAINAGLSGETSAGGKNRIDWLLRQPVDVFVLELGANDGLRGIPPSETKKNLQAIVDKVKAKYPNAKLVMAGMEVPPNMGGKYAGEFRVIFRELANENNMALVPFLLEGVGGVRSLNQPDGVHPTAAGQKILASNVWEVLKDVL